MSVLTDYGLKDPDVEFLLAVHQIEQNPTEYDNTDVGETVANVTSIREASDLTRSQIDYRVSPGDGGRGFGEDGMNFLRTYEATIEGRNMGPRSVELTEKGERVVAEIKEMRSGGGGQSAGSGDASSERIAELETRISEHESMLENFSDVAETVATIEQNEMGAVSSEMTTQIRAASNAIPHHQFVFSEVFGIGIEDMREVDEDDEDAIRQLQVTAYNHLQQALDKSESGE
jgi:uncharacterized coiled-coil protein SlyX